MSLVYESQILLGEVKLRREEIVGHEGQEDLQRVVARDTF